MKRHYVAGDRLFTEGDASTSLFIIESGSVAIQKKKGQDFIEIAKIHSKEVLGELSFFDRLPRSASAVAMTQVEAIEIEFASLDTIYASVPPYFKTIMAAVAYRLRRANDMIRRLKTVTTEAEGLMRELESETGSGGIEIADLEKLLAGNSLAQPE